MNKQRLVPLLVLPLMLACSRETFSAPTLTAVDVGPQSPSPVCQGGAATFVVTVTRIGNGNMDVYLTAAGLPPGATASFSPNPVKFAGPTPPTGTSTLVISTTGGTPPGADPFSVIADDGGSLNTKTNTGALNVSLCSAGVAQLPDGSISLTFPGVAGQTYLIQATTNLAAPVWTTICTTNMGNNNVLKLIDSDSTNYPMRFYRMSLP